MYTRHAQARCQQRGIPPEAVEAILAYGNARRHDGADVYYFDKRARSRAEAALGRPRFCRIEKALDSYVVLSDDGSLLTAAHRLRRLKF